MKSHLSIHIGSTGTIRTILQPRLADGTFTRPVSIARPLPGTSHVADYSHASVSISRTRLR